MSEAWTTLGAAPYALAAFLAVAVILPLGVMHYAVAWRRIHAMTPRDERVLRELWLAARQLEARMDALETVMDMDAPIGREGRMDHVRKTH